MTGGLPAAAAVCSIFMCALIAAPAEASSAAGEPALQSVAEEQQEAALEATEAAVEQAEVAEARAEDLAFADPSTFRGKTAEEFPAMGARIPRIEGRLARLRARKAELRELPLRAKRRKAFLHRKHERIVEEMQRMKGIFEKLRAKRQALHT